MYFTSAHKQSRTNQSKNVSSRASANIKKRRSAKQMEITFEWGALANTALIIDVLLTAWRRGAYGTSII